MRRIRFEQLRRASIANFIRDAKKFLLSKRNESVQEIKPRRDSALLLDTNITVDTSKDNENLSKLDHDLELKQKHFVDFVANTIKKDGKRGRMKDAQIRKTILDFLSHDLKQKFKEKNMKLNVQVEFEKLIKAFIDKNDRQDVLRGATQKDIRRKFVPEVNRFKQV